MLKSSLIAIPIITCMSGNAWANTFYVDASKSGDGSDWANAYASLQDALGTAISGDEIWVAAGTYYPTTGADRTISFQLATGVAIYGGFNATETTRDARDWNANETILSGDIGTIGVDTDNSYNVVFNDGSTTAIDNTAILDGFVISGGYANGSNFPYDRGTGIHNNYSSPTLTHVTISGNYAGHEGGGIYNISSSPILTNVTISGNYAVNSGGGIFNYVSSPILTNVTISGNYAISGGGIYNLSSNIPPLINTIIWGNTATNGNSIFNNGSTPDISHSIIEGSGGSASWNTAYGTDSGNNKDADPLFVTPLDPANAPSTVGDFHLKPTSPAIEAGDNTAVSGINTDLDGNPRIVNSLVDMGAYEFLIFVDTNAIGTNNGSNWTNAYTSLQAALTAASGCGEIWVAAGTYYPTTETDRSISFKLANCVSIYGGFNATESTRDARDWNANVTTLSGDIGTVGVDTDNSFHVVHGDGSTTAIDNTAILDGFVISGGNANGIFPGYNGAGIYNVSSSPNISNVTISGNSAVSLGGGIYNVSSSSPNITNVTISGNSVNYYGGGISNENSQPTLTNVTISGNSALSYGGGIFNLSSTPTLTNVTISGNSAEDGGGIYNLSSSSLTLTNVIIWGNTTTTNGNSIVNNGSTSVISYSIIEGSGGSSAWDTTFGTDSGNNKDEAPLFVIPIPDPANDTPTTEGDFHISVQTSPAINAGNDAVVDCVNDTDLDGLPRCIANGAGDRNSVDMGAYEFPGEGTPIELIEGSFQLEGNSIVWATAMELENDSFNLYRHNPTTQECHKINDTLIPAMGDASYYSYDVIADMEGFNIWLEDLSVFGKSMLHGPAGDETYLHLHNARELIEYYCPE